MYLYYECTYLSNEPLSSRGLIRIQTCSSVLFLTRTAKYKRFVFLVSKYRNYSDIWYLSSFLFLFVPSSSVCCGDVSVHRVAKYVDANQVSTTVRSLATNWSREISSVRKGFQPKWTPERTVALLQTVFLRNFTYTVYCIFREYKRARNNDSYDTSFDGHA